MKKKIIFILGILVLGCLWYLGYQYVINSNVKYTMSIQLIDDKSPDRRVIIKKNGKEISFKEIRYNIDKEVVLCKGENPTINLHDTKGYDDYVLVLKNNKEIIVKLEEEVLK